MTLPINGLSGGIAPVPMPQSSATTGSAASAGATSFKDYLLNSLDQVNSMQQDANQAIETMAVGGDVNPAEVLTAVQKADLAFRLTMQIRNKLVAAYQEVQNIRI
jgi:flagellar hook-basal body complex protein FliE